MREDDRIRILHMIDAANDVGQFISGREQADLRSDRMLRFAVVRAIEIIGEAASQLSEETRVRAPDVPWRAIIGMRNRIIHAYWDIDVEILWKTATEAVPRLVPPLRALAGEGGGAE
jgi:uncharacterized protein with HEPN domain